MIFINFCIICLTESVRVWTVVHSRFMCRIVATRCTVYRSTRVRSLSRRKGITGTCARRFGQNTTSIRKSGLESNDTLRENKTKLLSLDGIQRQTKTTSSIAINTQHELQLLFYTYIEYALAFFPLFVFRFIYVYRYEMYWNCSRVFFFASRAPNNLRRFFFAYFAIDKRSNYFRHAWIFCGHYDSMAKCEKHTPFVLWAGDAGVMDADTFVTISKRW